MEVLVGVAAQGPGSALRLGAGCRRLAREARIHGMSRPWWAPAGISDESSLVAVGHVETRLPRQEVRPWLWALERALEDRLRFVLLAGKHNKLWRWGIEPDEEGGWIGPLADVLPDLVLRNGLTAKDRALLRPHPGAFPSPDAGRGPLADPGDQEMPSARAWTPPTRLLAARRTSAALP